MSPYMDFAAGRVFEPLYKLETDLFLWEAELLAAPPLRRLKLLHHYGAGALCTPVVHSRLEHTLGVWTLAALFYPDDRELRLAALLHDVGHLPFSHAAEKALGLSHHTFTEALITGDVLAPLLRKHGFRPMRIVELLGQNTPLTSQTGQLGLDHLDSFLRDTSAAGLGTMPPDQLIRRVGMLECGVNADELAAFAIMDAIEADHRLFLDPKLLAMDAFLAEAVLAHVEAEPGFKDRMPAMADHELLYALERSPSETARDAVRLVLWEPHRIRTASAPFEGSRKVEVRKMYGKLPWIEGLPAAAKTARADELLSRLRALAASYYISC